MTQNKEIVRQFLIEIRGGKNPDRAAEFMAESVLAHQMNAENQTTVQRSPENYANHIKDFLRMFGDFELNVTELIAEDDRVYARWEQKGKHLDQVDDYAPTGKDLLEIASCVYRLKNAKIVEYWIQIDRLGFEVQLKENAIS